MNKFTDAWVRESEKRSPEKEPPQQN